MNRGSHFIVFLAQGRRVHRERRVREYQLTKTYEIEHQVNTLVKNPYPNSTSPLVEEKEFNQVAVTTC